MSLIDPVHEIWGFTRTNYELLSCQPRVTVTSRFVYNVTRDIESIDHLCLNPSRRIGLIHKCYIDSRKLKWSVQVNVLLNNCKQKITLLSLLADTTINYSLIFPLNSCAFMFTDVFMGVLFDLFMNFGTSRTLSETSKIGFLATRRK